MEKITLKLFEFYNLDAELNGVVNQQTGEKVFSGLVQEKLPLSVKYWLNSLAKTVKEEKTAIEDLKNELIKKYGKEDPSTGGISIPMVVDELDEDGNPIKVISEDGKEVTKKKFNPDYQAFEKEFNDLLQTEKELDYKPFSLVDFEKVETSEIYTTFFKLIKVEESKVVPMN